MSDSVFAYTPPNSLLEFFHSPKRARFIRGPVGCLPAETEFLSMNGWVPISKYHKLDYVAQWDEETSSITFVEPDEYIVLPCEEFYRFYNKNSLDMVVSAEHRVPHYDWKGKFDVKLAEFIAAHPSTREIPINFYVSNTPGIALSDDMLRLAVCLNADGTLPLRGNQLTFTFRKARKKERFVKILEAIGADWSEYHNPNRPTEVRYTIDRPNHPLFGQKTYDGMWWDAAQLQLEIILEECLLWDGLANHEEERFYSTHKQDADFIQYAAHACGRRACISIADDKRDKSWSSVYTVFITTRDSYKRCVRIRNTTSRELVPSSDGKKYCFSVPTGFFPVRHNGKIFITGNSVKSTAMVMELFRRSCERRPDSDGIRRSKMAIVRNTYRQLRETCLVTIRKTLGPLVTYRPSQNKIIFNFDMGPRKTASGQVLEASRKVYSEWLLWPLDTPENIENLLSLELTGAWLSEFREIDPEIAVNLLARCGRYEGELAVAQGGGEAQKDAEQWYGMIAETNSFSEDSPWYELLELGLKEGWGYFVQPGAFDPKADWKHFLPNPRYYEELLEDHTEAWAEQYIHNRITPSLSSQAVFARSFDSHYHIVNDLEFIPHRPLVLGMDTGRQPAAVAGQLSARGRLNILASIYAENCGMEKFLAEYIKPWIGELFPRANVYAIIDPAGRVRDQVGEKSVLEVIKEAGVLAVLASTNKIDPRLRAVERYLNLRNGLAIDKRHNTTLIRALQHDYRYSRNREKALLEIPDKTHPASDLVDALQYLCLGINSNIIGRALTLQQKKPSTLVTSSAGWT